MAFFDDMINGIRGMFSGAPKPQQNNSANSTVRNNLSKGVGFGVFLLMKPGKATKTKSVAVAQPKKC